LPGPSARLHDPITALTCEIPGLICSANRGSQTTVIENAGRVSQPEHLAPPPAVSVLTMRARAFSASLEPLIPLLRNARRDTGFPAAASPRATMRA
jgi:hypothetical protein